MLKILLSIIIIFIGIIVFSLCRASGKADKKLEYPDRITLDIGK